MENLLPIAAASACFAGAAGVYRCVRPRFPVEVNCHFCNATTKVPFGNQNCWDCPECDQYNGFAADGDYNKPIPSQYIEDLNHPITAENKALDPDLDISGNSLCENCNRNQSIKIRQLANFVPEKDDSYDEEIESYRRYLDRLYCLCQGCEYKLQGELQKQDVILSKKLDKYFSEMRRKDDSHTEVSSTTFHDDLRPQIFKSRRKTILQLIAFFLIIMLILNTAQELIKHSPAFEDTPIYLKVFTMGTNTVLTISLLGGVTQGLNILLAGRSRLRRRDIFSIIIWVVVILFHSPLTSSVGAKTDKTDFYLGRLSIDIFCAIVSLVILTLPHQDPTSPRKMLRPLKLNSSNCSRMSDSFGENNDNIPDDIEPRQRSPRSTANQPQPVDNFAALETMSIGSAKKTSPRYLRAFGAFGDTSKFSPLPNHPPSPVAGLHHRRHNRILLSPARFAPTISNSRPTSTAQIGQNSNRSQSQRSGNNVFGQVSSGQTWTSLGSLSSQQARPLFGRPGNNFIDPDRASLFSEPRIRNDNHSDRSSSIRASTNSQSARCPVDSTIPDQPQNRGADTHDGHKGRRGHQSRLKKFVKTFLVAVLTACLTASACIALIHWDVLSGLRDLSQSLVLPS